MGKCLTVKDLKNAFGDEYSAVNSLIKGKPDNYVFGSLTTVDTNDYFVTVLWGKKDIACLLEKKGIEPTEKIVGEIFRAVKEGDVNDAVNMNENMIEIIQNKVESTIESRIPRKCS